jgi:hypothetical protein
MKIHNSVSSAAEGILENKSSRMSPSYHSIVDVSVQLVRGSMPAIGGTVCPIIRLISGITLGTYKSAKHHLIGWLHPAAPPQSSGEVLTM